MIPDWVCGYLSIDYEKQNCWELIQQVYFDRYAIDIGGIEKQRTHMREGEWVDVFGTGVVEGDVLLFKSTAINRHVGIVLTPELMLHTIRGANSCIERWEAAQWRTRLVGIYRHKTRC